ncbi:glycosyl hydrolase [Candidatus Hydrogenedentota bacterium]
MAELAIPPESNGVKFPYNWRKCVGSGHMGLALQREYLELLEICQREIGFDYIRGHGLLSDPMGVYRETLYHGINTQPLSGPVHNFTHVDKVFDSFLELNIQPFVELGFMPGDLASSGETCFWWAGNITPPKDYARWRALIKSLVKHLISRYGIEEVVQWPFEVWNEPDIKNFWKDADQEAYFRLYRETATAIKEVESCLTVGGPATCPAGMNWLQPFMEFCDSNSIPLDFLSHHAYCAKTPERGPEVTYHDLKPNTDLVRQFKEAREKIVASAFSDNMPLHITEYNTSYSPLCPIHDSTFNAAYLARTLSEGGDFADSFSYWTFSDVFAEADVPKAQFHGGFGLVAMNGIRKPTFHLFSFFSCLGGEMLYRDENVIVTRHEDGTVALIAWNDVMEAGQGFEKDFDLRIPVSFPEVCVKQQVVDEENGNPWRVWKEMGRPRYPDAGEIDTLHHAAVPALNFKRMTPENGFLKLKLKLGKNAFTLVELSPLEDETSTYVGLDDSKIPGQ